MMPGGRCVLLRGYWSRAGRRMGLGREEAEAEEEEEEEEEEEMAAAAAEIAR